MLWMRVTVIASWRIQGGRIDGSASGQERLAGARRAESRML